MVEGSMCRRSIGTAPSTVTLRDVGPAVCYGDGVTNQDIMGDYDFVLELCGGIRYAVSSCD